jgi:predicted nucleic acid-binding protein
MVLADSSAWIVSRRPDGARAKQIIDGLLSTDDVAICDMVRFELLYSTRNAAEMEASSANLEVLRDCPIGKREWQRGLWVYQRMADQGGAHHRSVGYPDLLIAAAAESAGATLLHYDEHFNRIAAITGQPTEWIVPRGSL